MLKKFFRKVRKVAKDIAPIAAPIAGLAFGAPVGMGIGALLGQYGGREGALRAAALGGIGGLAGNYAATGKLLGTKGMVGNVGFKEGMKNIFLGKLPAGVDPNVAGADLFRSTRTGGIMNALGAAGKFAMSPKGLLTGAAFYGAELTGSKVLKKSSASKSMSSFFAFKFTVNGSSFSF